MFLSSYQEEKNERKSNQEDRLCGSSAGIGFTVDSDFKHTWTLGGEINCKICSNQCKRIR